MSEKQTGIEVNVVDWKTNGAREVAIIFHDTDQMLTIDAESARSLAFMLMECADFIEPPFDDARDSLFGPYQSEEEDTKTEDDDEPST